MANLFENLGNSAVNFSIMDAVDILLVASAAYGLLRLTTKTRASQVFKGLAVFIVVAWICSALGLSTVNWLLSSFIDAGAVLLVVIFQPEIRRAFEKVGRGGLFENPFSAEEDASRPYIGEIERAIPVSYTHLGGGAAPADGNGHPVQPQSKALRALPLLGPYLREWRAPWSRRAAR